MFKKILIGIVIAFILLVIITALSDDDTDSTNDNVATDAVSVDAEPVETIVVTADELFADYESNEVAADMKYKGKMLDITGKVDSITSGMGDKAQVNLVTSNQFQSATGRGDKDFTAKAATLKKGETVRMICKGDGEVIGSPQLKDCVIQ